MVIISTTFISHKLHYFFLVFAFKFDCQKTYDHCLKLKSKKLNFFTDFYYYL